MSATLLQLVAVEPLSCYSRELSAAFNFLLTLLSRAFTSQNGGLTILAIVGRLEYLASEHDYVTTRYTEK